MMATLERTIIVYGPRARRREWFEFACDHCPGRVETAPLGAVDMVHKCRDGSIRYLRGVK